MWAARKLAESKPSGSSKVLGPWRSLVAELPSDILLLLSPIAGIHAAGFPSALDL